MDSGMRSLSSNTGHEFAMIQAFREGAGVGKPRNGARVASREGW